MSGYRWRGSTPRHEATRRWADAQWEHDQRCQAQRNRQDRAAPDAPSPAAGDARSWQAQAIAATIHRTVTTAQGATP